MALNKMQGSALMKRNCKLSALVQTSTFVESPAHCKCRFVMGHFKKRHRLRQT